MPKPDWQTLLDEQMTTIKALPPKTVRFMWPSLIRWRDAEYVDYLKSLLTDEQRAAL